MSLRHLFFLLVLLGFAMICATTITFLVVLEMNPKLNSSKADEEDAVKVIEQDRDKLNRQIGMKAFRRLEEKYGCDATHECYW